MMKNRSRLLLAIALVACSAPIAAQQPRPAMTPEQRAERRAAAEQAFQTEITMERPIAALNSIWIEELTWIEIRDAMADGKTTVIIPTGGIEQNGPYVALGKHNYILQTHCEGIARTLGNALCAPIIKLVPEGNIENPSGHMRYPGTISLREETFRAVLTDVGESLKAHGFEHIVYIGDSGGNQRGMRAVAEALNTKWGETVAHHISEFYDNAGVENYLREELGITEGPNDGYHDFYWITALQMVTDPATVRYEERVAAGKATINGLSIAPMEETIDVGRKLLLFRVNQTVRAINAATGASH